jgi:hypothetical protein
MGIPEWIREIAAWPDWPNLHDQLSPWRDYATLGIAVIVWRVLVARQSQTEQIAAFFLAQRHQADIERYRDSAELHRALASMLADAFGSPTHLLPDSLVCAVTPSPFLVMTRTDGVRIYVTQQPHLLRRVGLVRRIDRSANLTRGISTRQTAMRAIWEAVCARTDMPQPALPTQQDWHALITGTTIQHRHVLHNGGSR